MVSGSAAGVCVVGVGGVDQVDACVGELPLELDGDPK
jgi:hypothetical protein